MNQRQTILQMTLILSYTVSLSTGKQLIKLFCYFSIYVDLKLSTALLHLSFYSYFILDFDKLDSNVNYPKPAECKCTYVFWVTVLELY